MLVREALEIGLECGLETVGEAVLNIQIHAASLFGYSDIPNEVGELLKDEKALYSETSFTNESAIPIVIAHLVGQDVDEMNKDKWKNYGGKVRT